MTGGKVMVLTERQMDSLVELINIAFGRAAASLSDLTGERIILDVPEVGMHPLSELNDIFGGLMGGEVATVHQIFTGPVAGNAMLLIDYAGALALSELLTSGRPQINRLNVSDREVLTEVGNILLSACLGTFGNLLQVHISFSVPRMHIDSLNALLHSLTIGKEELQYALVVFTNFRLRDSAVEGYLVIVLGVASLDRLIQSLERLG
jgi:chemotaxis protein CheC